MLILVAYVVATVGAIRFLFFRGEAKVPMWQLAIPLLGGAFVCYTIYRNVFIGQTGALASTPYIEVVYLSSGWWWCSPRPGWPGACAAGWPPARCRRRGFTAARRPSQPTRRRDRAAPSSPG